MLKFMLIGGFAYAPSQLDFLSQLPNTQIIEFIDINAYSPPVNLATLSQQLVAKLTTSNIYLCAYSTGALLALKLALDYPHLIKKIILLNASPCFLASDNWNGVNITNLQNLERKLKTYKLAQFLNYFNQLAHHPFNINPQVKFSSYCHIDNLLAWLEVLANSDWRNQLIKIQVPMLWIYATKDNLIPFNQLNLPIQQIIIADSSHAKLNHSAICQAILDFIDE